MMNLIFLHIDEEENSESQKLIPPTINQQPELKTQNQKTHNP
jgi:hypothetical protein